MGKEQVYSCAKEIALRLKNYRKYGRVSLMVGAGFSKNAISKGTKNIQPPNWSELADKMYCELYPEIPDMDEEQKKAWERQRTIKTSGKNVTKLAEEYIVYFDRNKMNHLIENSIADDMFMPGELHKRLLKLRWGDIFTTNYDTLLERASDLVFRENGYKLVCSQNDIPGSISPRIVKLHGSIPQVKPYIICDEDYRTYPDKHAPMVNTVQQAMLETRLCLIGFSGDDPNFQNWLGWLRDNMGECCPIIYLIGIYDDLSGIERKLLESRQITIIDLSCLVEKNEANRHSVAISKFLDLLERYQEEEKEENILEQKPYPDADVFWEPKDKKKYIKDLGEYSSRVAKWMQPYIILPEEIRRKCENYFTVHFRVLINRCKEQLPVIEIADTIRILRKCSVILDDDSAKCLEGIYEKDNDITFLTNDELDALIEIGLYLAEMYRIDSKKTEYERKLSSLEELVKKIPWHKNELLLEKIKYKIENFEYEQARALAGEIEENSFEYKIKKAGIYKQLSEYDLADKILSECSSELAQMKISEDIYVSYLGYLNLCYRINKWKISDEYSDENYFENPYNTRQIIMKQRDSLSQVFFKDDCKEEERVLPFNLNTGKNITYMIGVKEAYEKSFCYLITLDKLCLPLFSDLAALLPRVFKEIIDSSNCIQWKLSLVARSNNDKLINQIFTRETLGVISKEERDNIFYSLLSLAELYKTDDDYFQKKYIISLKDILNILSKLLIFMPDENFVQYLNVLSPVSKRNDRRIIKDVNEILRRISTRFNSAIAASCQDIIFSNFGTPFYLANYFSNFSFSIDENNVRNYYLGAVSLASSEDMTARDCGISQLLVLWKNCRLEEFQKIIEDALWDGDILPRSELYYPFIWEELPHPDSTNFSELYYKYLFEDRYLTTVTGFGVIRTNSLDSVRIYLNFYYATSKMSKRKIAKVEMDEKLAVFMLEIAYDYILHEKSLLQSDFDKYSVEQKFEYIGELVALIYIEAIVKGFVSILDGKIDAVWKLLDENQIVVDAIKMVSEIKRGHYNMCMDFFENTILSKNKKNYSSVFVGMKCLFYYLENKGERNTELDDSFERFMSSIKYLDIEYAKKVWMELATLITHDYFMEEKAQKYISSTCQKCIELYNDSAKRGQRFYMDGLYNCVNALRGYYDCIVEAHVGEIQDLKDCIAKAKNIENYEIKNILADNNSR